MPAFFVLRLGKRGTCLAASQSYFVAVADFLYMHFSRLTLRRISTMVRPTAGETGFLQRRRSNRPGNSQAKGPQSGQTLWKAGHKASPKEQPALSREISQGKDRGGTHFPP